MKLKSLLAEALNPLDKKAVSSFFDGKPFEGKNLNSDGKTLKTVGIGSQPMYTHTPNGVKMVGKVTGGYSQSLVQYVNKIHKGDLTESVNEAVSVSQVRSTIDKVKKQLIQKWKQKGGYENFGEKEGRMLSDKFNANPYGSPDERRIHSMIQDFENWAMNYDGRSESVNEAKVIVYNEKTGERYEVLSGKGKGDLLIAMKALQTAAPSHMKYSIKESVNEGKDDFMARYDRTNINLKKGYKHHTEDELTGLYDKLGKLLKNLKVKDATLVFESVAGREAMGIAGFTGTRGDSVQKFIDDNNLDAKKLFAYIKGGKLKDRMEFVSAIAGTPGNKVQKELISKFKLKEGITEVKYPTDLKVGSVIMGQGFTALKGIDGGKYYKVVEMDDTTATLVQSDIKGNVKGTKKVRHKLSSIEGGIKTAKRGDENGIVVVS